MKELLGDVESKLATEEETVLIDKALPKLLAKDELPVPVSGIIEEVSAILLRLAEELEVEGDDTP